VAERIQFLGFVSDADLLQLYNACDCFVFPSFYEGFGLPALESMACGRAVVCSDASALPELVDGAAILFDPYAIDDMVTAIADILIDGELRGRMQRLGIQRGAFQLAEDRAADLAGIRTGVGTATGLRSGDGCPLEPHSSVVRNPAAVLAQQFRHILPMIRHCHAYSALMPIPTD
jgi:hypothetical protein